MLTKIEQICDLVLQKKNLQQARKFLVIVAVISFLATIIFVTLLSQGWIELPKLNEFVRSYYFAFYVAFSFILTYETLTMIFTIPYSMANSVGKQFEIISLIIIRYVFEHLGKYSNIHYIAEDWQLITELLIICGGAVLLFLLTHIYYKIQKHRAVTKDPHLQERFMAFKKIISVLLIVILIVFGFSELIELIAAITDGSYSRILISHIFFKNMFTVMIFFDIFLVLITMWYSASYSVVFWVSSLSISTVILRLSFTEDIKLTVLLSLVAVLLAVGVSLVYNYFELNIPYDKQVSFLPSKSEK